MNFSSEILSWYHIHKRDLPWRNSKDPYLIWLSEIILQQTRVEQGMPYYYRFSEKYPGVSDFAAATEDEILRIWQGLGYYSRGRNMHYTAKMVMEKHQGYFPRSYEQLLKLKGIGEYTAAAISSFSANEARAVVDGNVFRLLARYFGIEDAINTPKGRKIFTELANDLLDPEDPGIFNQAIMEFGSLQCKPRKPDCVTCPIQTGCEAFRLDKIGQLPVKVKKQASRQRYFNYIVAVKDDHILMNKRGPNDIWQNLYELPLFETSEEILPGQLLGTTEFQEAFGNEVSIHTVQGPVQHILSHQKISARFIAISDFSEDFCNSHDWKYFHTSDLDKLAQPKLIFAFLKNFTDIHSN